MAAKFIKEHHEEQLKLKENEIENKESTLTKNWLFYFTFAFCMLLFILYFLYKWTVSVANSYIYHGVSSIKSANVNAAHKLNINLKALSV